MVPGKIINVRDTVAICLSGRVHSSIPTLFWEDEARVSKHLSQDRREGKGDMTVLFPWKLAREYFKAPQRD